MVDFRCVSGKPIALDVASELTREQPDHPKKPDGGFYEHKVSKPETFGTPAHGFLPHLCSYENDEFLLY